MQTNTIELTPKHYLIIFVLFILASSITSFALNILFEKSTNNGSDSEIILFNLKVLDEKISDMEKIVKSNAGKVKLKDRLDSDLVAEFGDDDAFLQKIAILKKQIVKRRLESEVIKLENEKIARDNTISDVDIYDSPYQTNVASKIFEIMMINSSNGVAVIRVDSNVVSVREGSNIKGFIVRKINPDSVIMGREGADNEVLGLNYLSSKLYQEKKDNKDVK